MDMIDVVTLEHDVIIDRGKIRRRKKKPSKKFRDDFGHTPALDRGGDPLVMPTIRHRHRCLREITGHGRGKTRSEATRGRAGRVATAHAIEVLRRDSEVTNAILHVAC